MSRCVRAELFGEFGARASDNILRKAVCLILVSFFVFSLIPVTFTARARANEKIQTFYGSRNETGVSRPRCIPCKVVVKFKREAAKEEIAAIRIGHDAEEVYVSAFTSARVWRVPPSKTVEEWVSFFGKHPLVEYAEPNYYRYALWCPNDPYYVYQWHFDDDHTNNPGGASSNPYGGANGGGIGMEEVWAVTNGSLSVVVAVIDTGVAYEDYTIPSYESRTVKGGVKNYQKAPDLSGTSFWQNEDEIAGNGVDDDGNGFIDDVNGWDFVNNDAHPNDNNAHGTHVTGTIAQTTNNGLGVAGIAFNTTIMPVKVLDYDGGGTDVWVADGIYYAVDNGAKIINLSLGGDSPSTTLENAVAYAYNHGVVVVAASGNDGTESVDYPAAYDAYVIAVGATRYDETRASYSDYGYSLDLVAPGGDLDVDQNVDEYGDGVLQQTFKPYVNIGNKADPTDWGYYFFDGTSMATPHVSGVAALLLAQDSALTPDQVRYALESTAEDLGDSGRDDFYGWGLIDASAALQSIQYSLTVNIVGSGLVTKDPDQAFYVSGAEVTLTAVPVSGWTFSGWSGDLTGSTNPTTITMDSDKTVTATFTSLALYDFGTDSSPVEAGYTRITESTLYSAPTGYGWISTAGLESRVRSAPDNLKRDLVFSQTEHTFNVDLANGDYQITLIVGDQDFGHDLIDVYCEDVLKIYDLTATAGTFQETMVYTTVTDGQLNVRILDDGGTDLNWVINALTIEPGPPPTPPSEAAFDFGASGSSVETGYTQVAESTLYLASTGYGWTITSGLSSRDRGAPDDLRRDLVFSSVDHTFNVDLQNGEYQAILVIGDHSYNHDLIDIYAEGILKVNDLTVVAGTFTEVAFTVTVSDGQLNLVFHDDGGTDPNWVINAIVVHPPPPPTSTQFDFGTGSSPVELGYTAVLEATLYSPFVGYGWDSSDGLYSRDRGSPDNLRRDFDFSSTDRTFIVDLPNGDYLVTVLIGDNSFAHDQVCVYGENVLKVSVSVNKGEFMERTFIVAVNDGQLNLVFHDDGGFDSNWVINAIIIDSYQNG